MKNRARRQGGSISPDKDNEDDDSICFNIFFYTAIVIFLPLILVGLIIYFVCMYPCESDEEGPIIAAPDTSTRQLAPPTTSANIV